MLNIFRLVRWNPQNLTWQSILTPCQTTNNSYQSLINECFKWRSKDCCVWSSIPSYRTKNAAIVHCFINDFWILALFIIRLKNVPKNLKFFLKIFKCYGCELFLIYTYWIFFALINVMLYKCNPEIMSVCNMVHVICVLYVYTLKSVE